MANEADCPARRLFPMGTTTRSPANAESSNCTFQCSTGRTDISQRASAAPNALWARTQ